ncbi:MAG: serine hydrolase domain-containing protein [Chthoniobacterales bacterium]
MAVSTVACFFIAGSSLFADPSSIAPVQKTLFRLVKRNKGHGGGVVRISGPGGVLYEGASGLTAGPGSPSMTPDTPFEIASITKAVTAVTIMKLTEDGKLSLDSRLGELLPEDRTRGFDKNITIRQLLSHTSGLPDYWTDGPYDHKGNNAFLRAFLAEPAHFWKPQEMLNFARDMPAKPPGKGFNYSDTNYVLLGLIIEHRTGRSLHDVFRSMIFEPLGMRDTWLTYHEKQRGMPPSHRYEKDDDLNAVPRQSADWASGGLVSTAHDLERFLRGLASGRLFKNHTTLDAMLKAVPVGEEDISYGLGLYRVKLSNGLGEIWGHDGHGNSFAYYWPQRDITFTGTLNQTENDWWPLAESFIEGKEPGFVIPKNGKSFTFSVITGWDSLYMYRGVNSLRDSGYGYGISWVDLTTTYGFTENDFLTFDLWQCFATQGPTYRELDPSVIYTHVIHDVELSLEYDFSYGYGSGNFYSNEIGATAARDFKFGKVTLTPSISYFFNFGPDAAAGNGFAKADSSYLLMRLDGNVPLYRNIISLAPWTALGVNFQYNTAGDIDDPQPFTGPNNFECGIALPIRLTKMVTVSGYAAYSRTLTDLTNTSPNTFWSGVRVTFSF